MDPVGVEKLLGRRIVALGLDALHFGEQPAHALAKRRRIDHHVERLAVALTALDRLRVRHEPVDDHLPVAHVRLLDRRAFADPPQLNERIARVALVLGADDVLLVRRRDETQFRRFRIGDEVQADQVRSSPLRARRSVP